MDLKVFTPMDIVFLIAYMAITIIFYGMLYVMTKRLKKQQRETEKAMDLHFKQVMESELKALEKHGDKYSTNYSLN